MTQSPEGVPGKWYAELEPTGTASVRVFETDEVIATVHGGKPDQLKRAWLIARAPALREAAAALLQVMHLMKDDPEERVSATARDFIPVLESALYMTEPV